MIAIGPVSRHGVEFVTLRACRLCELESVGFPIFGLYRLARIDELRAKIQDESGKIVFCGTAVLEWFGRTDVVLEDLGQLFLFF